MRINKFVAQASGLSRRAADAAISASRITINERRAEVGDTVSSSDIVTLDGKLLGLPERPLTILLNKPTGYVCSRNGQGSLTVYDLLPYEFQELKPVGRLDKDSSGLLLLTNDGELANMLTHPRYHKLKKYEIRLDRPLAQADSERIKAGVHLDDYISHLTIESQADNRIRINMSEGKNRQIRYTFEALGYRVVQLHRSTFGDFSLGSLSAGQYRFVE